jgi:putative transposase
MWPARDASEERGIEGHKKVKGRKRHIVVDTLESVLKIGEVQ